MNPFSFMRHVRVLPVTIASLSLLLSAKLYDIYQTGNEFSKLFLGREAYAQEQAAPPPAVAEQQTPNETNQDETQLASIQPEQQSTAKEPAKDEREFSEIELNILQSLSERREELDALEKEINMKGNVLDATEARLDQKIEQIKAMEQTMQELLKEYDSKEDAKIRSLVKIYETMKPKDAARIFDELEMPILLLVVDKMSERKAAPILASMTPAKAKQLTVELAEQRKLRAEQTSRAGISRR